MNSRRLLAISACTLLLLACNTGSGGIATNGASMVMAGDANVDSTDDFDVTIEQTNTPQTPPTRASDPAASIDVKYVITVHNRISTPVKVQRIDLQSVSGSQAEVPFSTRAFKRTIAPSAKEKFDFWANLNLADGRLGGSVPMLLRVMITFVQGQTERRESFTRRVNGRAVIGVS